MTSLMTRSVFVITCSMITVQFAAADLSHNSLDFMGTLNGIYDNWDQHWYEGKKFVLFQAKAKPVYVPALQKEPMIYYEAALKGKTFTMTVGSVFEDPYSGEIDSNLFNIINQKQYSFNTFNTDELKNYPQAYFKRLPKNCTRQFSKMYAGVYTGVIDVCKQVPNPESETFTTTATCDFIIAIPYDNSKKGDYYKRTGKKYPLLDAEVGYTCPCKKGKINKKYKYIIESLLSARQ